LDEVTAISVARWTRKIIQKRAQPTRLSPLLFAVYG
jgi:hypothetical protein